MSYRFCEEPPTPEEYVSLREAAGMKPRTETAARRGLSDTTQAVTVRTAASDELVGMGRLIGDGGCYYRLVDIAVHPDHHGRDLGTRVVEALMDYLRENVPLSAYATPISDVDGFYERFGSRTHDPSRRGCSFGWATFSYISAYQDIAYML
jgi:GNAT superfamily N-acetyltransferase